MNWWYWIVFKASWHSLKWCEKMISYALFFFSTIYGVSSSCHAISIDIPGPLSPPLPIVHCFRQVLRAISRIGTELLYVGSSWSSWFCTSMWRGPYEYITYELVPTSLAVSRMSVLGFFAFCLFVFFFFSFCGLFNTKVILVERQ